MASNANRKMYKSTIRVEDFIERCRKDFDYVRFTICDIFTASRAKIVLASEISNFLKEDGDCLGICAGAPIVTPTTNIISMPALEEYGFGDCYMIPDLDTCHACPWSAQKSGVRVGQVFCSLYWKNPFRVMEIDAREQCFRMCAKLEDEFGLRMYSAFEYEFVCLDKNSKKALFDGVDICSTLVHKEVEDVQFGIGNRLLESGLKPRTLHVEYGQGQNEITIFPNIGVASGDDGFKLRQCVKESALDFGIAATFMSKPYADDHTTNSGHLNFSLKNADGTNAFYDAEMPDQISQIARWFIAGVLRHASALCALMCPSCNCYRRIAPGTFVPCTIGWAVENRFVMIRFKNNSPKGTYAELRSASSAANPYLVIAGVIACGLDGIRKKMEPPEMSSGLGVEDCPSLPRTLAAALDAFQEDGLFAQEFGQEFIEWYVKAKKEADLPLESFEEEFRTYVKLI